MAENAYKEHDYSKRVYAEIIKAGRLLNKRAKKENLKATTGMGEEMILEFINDIASQFQKFRNGFFENLEECDDAELWVTPEAYVEMDKSSKYEQFRKLINATKNLILKEELDAAKKLNQSILDPKKDAGEALEDFVTISEKNEALIRLLIAKINSDLAKLDPNITPSSFLHQLKEEYKAFTQLERG